MPIRTIIFDASGTLLNDLYAVWKSNCGAYSSLGLNGPRTLAEFKARFKMPIWEFHKDNGVPPELIPEVDKKFREHYPQYASTVAIFPEVMGVLKELKKKKTILGITSNIPSLILRKHLKELNIYDYFDAVTGQEDCDEQKPSPKPILVTIEKLVMKPQESIYVGDMEEDMIAAKGANTGTAAIIRNESYHPRWRLEKHNPDFIISNLNELLLVCNGEKAIQPV